MNIKVYVLEFDNYLETEDTDPAFIRSFTVFHLFYREKNFSGLLQFRISPHHGSILSLRVDLNLSIWTTFWAITVVFLLLEACYYCVRVNITLYL